MGKWSLGYKVLTVVELRKVMTVSILMGICRIAALVIGGAMWWMVLTFD